MALTKVTTQMISEAGAKAWVAYNTNTTTTVHDSFNVASLTDDGTGDTTITFTVPMANADYAITCISSSWHNSAADADRAVGSCSVQTAGTTHAAQDVAYSAVAIFGDQ